MNYLDFRKKLFDLGCFSTDQVFAWQPGFDRTNLGRWLKKGLLIRLRQRWYCFPEYLEKADFAYYFANRIYSPSYISLHTALAFHGMIPESVVQITSVTSLKTNQFSNSFGEYSYKSIKPQLMFGFDLKPMPDGRVLKIASPEKAILDLLYLYPEYNTIQALSDLRLDEDFMAETINKEMLLDYSAKFKSKVMSKRTDQLLNTF
jgi:predicted transcriptional regulator of viral defense system